MPANDHAFEVICEVEPATHPDLAAVRRQIATMTGVASAFLVPDNHIGRATVSSIAVAHEIARLGGRAIACLNARDRNTLGFRRDLLTAAAYGVEEFLFVYGDRPESGKRSDDLTVRAMLDEARRFSSETGHPIRIGVSAGMGPLPAWKREADFLCAQVAFDADQLIEWRATIETDQPVHAGVMVVASASMGRKLTADIPQLAVPETLIDRLEIDADVGVDLALDLMARIRESGAFDGVHLIPVNRYRQITDRLTTL